MNGCPSEIWGEICAFACTDDGRTGRSLSLASWFLHQISKPFKLQSIAVVGYLQLSAFAELLERTPVQYRHVQCMFLSTSSRQITSDMAVISTEYSQRGQTYAVLERILCVIAPYVKIIHAFFVFNRPFILLPVSLPVLEELTLHGPSETSAVLNTRIQFESLKRLNMTSSCSPSFVVDKILKLTPSLTHLRLCASERSERVFNGWSSMATNQEVGFPSHLKRILIHAPHQPIIVDYPELLQLYDRIISALCSLGQVDRRISLLPPIRHGMFSMISIDSAMSIWSENGKQWQIE